MSKITISVACDTAEEAVAVLSRLGATPTAAADTPTSDGAPAAAPRGRGRPKKTEQPAETPAAEPTPAPKPTPAPAAKPPVEAVTVEQVREALNKLVDKKGPPAARELLGKYAKAIKDLKPSDYASAYADALEALDETQEAEPEADDDFLK